ncbi:MAG: VWA domain-containing protein, partial [bacterium]|nr:VWA domain-containing protein [bacterium]
MRFAYQAYLLLLLLIPILASRFWNRQGQAPLVYSDIKRVKRIFGVTGTRRPLSHTVRHILYLVRLLVLALFILALARPQAELVTSEVYTEGVDIVLTLDVSGSMKYIDTDDGNKATRIQITKDSVDRFIDGRKNDRIAMTVFAEQAFLQCPLTVDYGIVKSFLNNTFIGMIPETSTAIGNALASSLNRLRYSEAKSKVIILITDGANNAGQIDPLTAADMAKALGVRIYTIGVGGVGVPYVEVETIFG